MSTSTVRVIPYSPHTDGDVYIAGVVRCYQKSFAGPPWNESHVCRNCEQQFGADEVASCNPKLLCPNEGCSEPLQEYWPTSKVEYDFRQETAVTAERQPASWIALDGDTVVGICWGYTVTPEALAHKVGLPDLESALFDRFGDRANRVAYQDELAVLPEYRGKRFSQLGHAGIARALVEARHQDFVRMGVSVGTIRTLERPPTRTYEWYTHVGFEIIARYPDNRHRVILARSYDGLQY